MSGKERNKPCKCGSGKKFKYCCYDDIVSGKFYFKTITRNDFISGPFKDCPDCGAIKDFGVFTSISGSGVYTRECRKCHYSVNYNLPKITKKVIYLDQFVISELIKLLDKDHQSHNKILNGPYGKFWSDLFIALENASKSQAIICPDSFYHKDEASVGKIDFKVAKRLYEHFSGGKTLYPSSIIEKFQIETHFKNWLKGEKTVFNFDPQDISFDRDLNEWHIGMGVSIGGDRTNEEVSKLEKLNITTKKQLELIWESWKLDKSSFESKVKQEVLGLGKGTFQSIQNFHQRKESAIQRMKEDSSYELDIDDIYPPPSMDLVESLISLARISGIEEKEIPSTVMRYFNDADALLEVPYLKISSVMFAGLARAAAMGERRPPKSTVDVQFISSYLPYCDAMFIDMQSARMIRELPKDTSKKLRLDGYKAKIFTINEGYDFINYINNIVSELSSEQVDALRDAVGDDYAKPFWSIIEKEKNKLSNNKR